ncbi:MAG: hypothetical protein ACXWC8_05905 [Limisphaerales bacterium]
MPTNGQPVMLPEQLHLQFACVERRLWRVETAVAVCSAVAAVVISWLVLFVSDRIWPTPVWLRALLFVTGLAVGAIGVLRWMDRWVWHKRDQRELARLVQKKYRKLGDRLLGIVELAGEHEHSANFSPALYRAAIEQVANEAVGYDFPASVSARAARKFSAIAAAATVCLMIACAALPLASWNAMLRWVLPAANIPRYTLVTLEGFPAEIIVPHGEPFALSGRVNYRSFWKPHNVVGLIGTQPKIAASSQSGGVQLRVPAQVENGVLIVRAGDAETRVKILPSLRPAIKDLSASIQLPSYLRYEPQTQKLNSGALLVLEGSRAAFAGSMTRPLTEASMSSEPGSAIPLKLQAENFSTEPTPVDGVSHFTMTWKDNLGLTNAAPLRLSVQTQKDSPPMPDLPNLPRECAMLASDVLTIKLEARDDFGVRDIGLMWDFASDNPGSQSTVTETKIQTESPHEKKTEHEFKWSPSLFRIPPDSVVELQGYARDYFPERERIRTAPYRIRVLSPEQHAEMLRQRLEALMSSSEEVTRSQEKVVANARDAKENTKLNEQQQNARLGQTKDDQNRNANDLQNLAKAGERVLQEAMKNPIFKEDTVQKWSKTLQQWQDLAKQKMGDAAKSMQSAQQSSKNSDARQQEMAKAVQKAQEALEALQKMQQKASENLDQLQALTLAERLRRAGARETEISGDLQKNAQETIGLLPSELPDKLKQQDATLANGQQTVQQEASKLQSEISRFSERTGKVNYLEVSKAMKESRTSDELDRLGGEIRDNIVLQSSTDLGEWSKRFDDWAKKLEPEKDSEGGDGKGGGQSKKNDMTKTLVALLRLREGELTLRDQTSLLDSNRGTEKDYKEAARNLATKQKEIAEKLDSLEKDNSIPSLMKPFVETYDSLAEAQGLLDKPQTDKTTDDAQVKSVDLMTDLINLINEQAKRPPPQSQPQQSEQQTSAEDMAFLMQMMKNARESQGKPMQNQGGGNTSGGSANHAGGPINGNVQGKGAAARNVGKASSVIENAPAEFRDALENYYRGIEQNTH